MEASRKKKKYLPWIILAIALGIGGLTLVLLKGRSEQGEKDPLADYTMEVVAQDLSVTIEASGTVEPIQSVNVSPKIQGRLASLKVDQGDFVQAGQIIAVMENEEAQVQVQQAEANLSQAIASLKAAEINIPAEASQAKVRLEQAEARLRERQQSLPRELEQLKFQGKSAESRLALAQKRLDRYGFLEGEGAIESDRLDETQDEYNRALSNLQEIEQKLSSLQNTQGPELSQLESAAQEARLIWQQQQNNSRDRLNQLIAARDEALAQLEVRRVQLRDTFIKAPFSGIVTQRYAVEGAFVTPTTSASNTASATSSSIIALAKGLEVIAQIPEVDIARLTPGQKVEIRADAYPEDTFNGTIKTIAPEAIVDQNVTSFEVTISLENGQDKLRSKMNVDITFITNPVTNAVVVPTVAIVTEEGQPGVYLVGTDNQPAFKPVTLGITVEDQTQILQGITAGERIFIELPNNNQQNRPD